jgi:hypothetical protein
VSDNRGDLIVVQIGEERSPFGHSLCSVIKHRGCISPLSIESVSIRTLSCKRTPELREGRERVALQSGQSAPRSGGTARQDRDAMRTQRLGGSVTPP